MYEITLVTEKSGWYSMVIKVTKEKPRYKDSGVEVTLLTNILDNQYWQSSLAYHATSSASGSAIPEVYTVSTERFTV